MLGSRRVGRIEDGADDSVAGILALIETAQEDGPLERRLSRMCSQVAEITGADVVSAYVLEHRPDRTDAAAPPAPGGELEPAPGGELLVMRGNVGFPASAVGRVTLRVGEGITGMVAECMRTASVAIGWEQAQFKPVAGLPEHDFPAFLAIPLGAGRGVLGVLVLQSRDPRERPPAEIALATALAAPFSFALEAARDRAHLAMRASGSILLVGRGLAPGVSFGRAALLPPLDALSPGPRRSRGDAEETAARALRRTRRALERAIARLAPEVPARTRKRLDDLALILADARLAGALHAESSRGGVAAAAYRVALRCAQVPYQLGGGDPPDWWLERSREVEALCLLVRAAALGDVPFHRGSAIVAPNLTGILAVAAAARGATSIVCEADVPDGSLGAAVARAARIPLCAAVEGLTGSVRHGDRVIIDADAGTVRVHPTPTEIARARRGAATPV